MAIATAGIVDQDWANTLSEMITSDNYVDYYLEMGNYGWNFPVDADDEETIRIQTNYIDSATGLQFRRTQDVNNADIYFVQTDYQFLNTPIDDGTLGFISVSQMIMELISKFFMLTMKQKLTTIILLFGMS